MSQPTTAVKRKKSSSKSKNEWNITFWLLMCYFIIEYVRPQDYVPAIGVIRPAMIISIILATTWVLNGDKSLLKDTPLKMFLIFIFLSGFSLLYVNNHHHAFFTTRILIIYMFAAVLPLISSLYNEKRFYKLLNLWITMHLFIAVMCLLSGGTGSGGFLSDENDLSLTLGMAIPFAWFLSKSPVTTRRAKIFYQVVTVVLMIGVVATFSRGGFLGLVAVLIGIIVYSPNKFRNLVLLAMMAGIVVLNLPDKYVADMQTITDTEDSTRNDRLHSWKMGWAMFLENPVLGVGTANYPWRVGEYELKDKSLDLSSMMMHSGRVSHSLYFTLIPEHGLVGISLYLTILVSLWKKLQKIIRMDREMTKITGDPKGYELIARAFIVSVFCYLVSGAFISVLYYPHFWYTIGFIVAFERIVTGQYRKIIEENPDVEIRSKSKFKRAVAT